MCGAVLFAAAGIPTGSGKSKTEKVGKVTKAQVEVRHTFERLPQQGYGTGWGLRGQVKSQQQVGKGDQK
jgi:hypothetical protein